MRVHGATLRCTDECLRLVGGPEKGDPLGGATTVFSTPFTTETAQHTAFPVYEKKPTRLPCTAELPSALVPFAWPPPQPSGGPTPAPTLARSPQLARAPRPLPRARRP